MNELVSKDKAVSLYDFKDQKVRVLTDEAGDLWFVAKDICDVLDISNSHQAVSSLDDDEKGVYTVYTAGGNQDVNIISESGMYSIILRSRKPEAKEFKRWITREVLSSIRKTGSYSVKKDERTENEITMSVMKLAKGIIQDDYLEAKARIVLARQMGDSSELDAGTRPLYVQDYLKSRGLSSKELRRSASFGKRLKALYMAKYGRNPDTAPQEIRGRIVNVNAYTDKDRDLFDQAFKLMFGE